MIKLEKEIRSFQIDIGDHRYGCHKRKEIRRCVNVDIEDLISFIVAGKNVNKEICICAAVKAEDGDVIRGHRHADCFRAIELRSKKILKEQGAQEFITSLGRYVDRKEGARLMREAGIKSRAGFEFREDDILVSEDLY